MKYHYLTGVKRRYQPSWYCLTMCVLIGVTAGMLLMYWICDWGTHGYKCDTGYKKIICTKDISHE